MKKSFYILHFIFLILNLFLQSCTKPNPLNPFDPEVDPSDWAPFNIQIEELSDNSVKISWEDNCNMEDGFIIEQKNYNYSFFEIGNFSHNYFIVDSLIDFSYCFFRVKAYAGNYYSDYSNEILYSKCIFVDVNGGGDYTTIQAGINAATTGSIVLVQAGTYYEDIDYNGKNITICSFFLTTQDSAYISQTIINGNQNGSVVTFDSGEDSTAILCGFTIINGSYNGGLHCWNSNPSLKNLRLTNNSASNGGGMSFYNSSPSLVNVTISGNSADGNGGGIYCWNNSNPSLENVLLTGNFADTFGGGIYCGGDSYPNLVNVTISGNSSSIGGGIYCWNSNLSLVNCILWNNNPEGIHTYIGGSATVSFSDIQNGWTGQGNINSNPLFVYAIDPSQAPTDEGDFHLQSDSPCINAGNSDPQYNDPDGTRNDMGAYGGPCGDW